ncbi:prephenate dehydratase [Paenibacillus selenitireducens]|uniref:Prephenate dehydratase n=1 Tax=Paenibacillus selenitireducens TaxID=1324314 RepID=A0A1T2XKL2_9BACL|nr:prephenate dehydratase [Paenibacillus selenitireducens]OPA80362.1 prephenate dehydratase [Paenibacillus selenitireducens]
MVRIALLPEGSVSHEAANYIFQGEPVEMVHHKLISDVFLSTVDGKTDYSVIPIENTIEGSVSLHMDWLVHEVDLPIQAEWVYPSIQNLIGRRNELLLADEKTIDFSKINKVMSHPVAMAQCRQFLREHIPHADLEHVSSTAEAVKQVKDHPGEGAVAIGTTLGAANHGLDILTARVTDHQNNFTRFLLVGPKSAPLQPSSNVKTSILITPPEDYSGGLHQVLSAFAWRRINLSRIESRPTKKQLGNYYFYIDVEASMDSVLLPAAIAEIEAIGSQVRILGCYPSYTFDADKLV